MQPLEVALHLLFLAVSERPLLKACAWQVALHLLFLAVSEV